MSLVEHALDPQDIILAHTYKSLKFYQKFFKSSGQDVLFVAYGQPTEENAKLLLDKVKDFKKFQDM